jgi:hypothetical protein
MQRGAITDVSVITGGAGGVIASMRERGRLAAEMLEPQGR